MTEQSEDHRKGPRIRFSQVEELEQRCAICLQIKPVVARRQHIALCQVCYEGIRTQKSWAKAFTQYLRDTLLE